jgi:type II secretory pathway component PulF
MHTFGKIMAVLGAGLGITGVWVLALAFTFGLPSLPLLFGVAVVYGWMWFAFQHYRYGRQQEFLHVLTVATEAEVPLSSALWAYLSDRPHGNLRELWVALLLLFVAPGYYWIWHRRHSYDSKVERIANRLEAGVPLRVALESVPGVASRETLLAVVIGEPTGRLAFCLRTIRSPARMELGTLWLEITPRIAYPLLLVVMISGVLSFWTSYVGPKFQRIFADFDMPLPTPTQTLLNGGTMIADSSWLVALVCLAALAAFVALLFSASVRWYFPIVGPSYRATVRSRMLQMLSFLMAVERPVPQALGVLADSEYFIPAARRRLNKARRQVEQGATLADGLQRGGMLPSAMVPLVKAAERAGHLPWALAELAEHLAQRTLRRVRRVSLAVFPIPILALGLLVGYVVFAIFMPLLALVGNLSR